MTVIRVPKPPKQAYNPRRPAGTLLQNQLRHLEWAVRPAAARTPKTFKIKPAKSEREAAARIEALTQELHRQHAVKEGVTAAPAPPARRTRATPKRKSASRRSTPRRRKGR